MTNKKQHAGAPIKALLGRKLGMTQVWDADGHLVPLTVVQVGTNVVTQMVQSCAARSGASPSRAATCSAISGK